MDDVRSNQRIEEIMGKYFDEEYSYKRIANYGNVLEYLSSVLTDLDDERFKEYATTFLQSGIINENKAKNLLRELNVTGVTKEIRAVLFACTEIKPPLRHDLIAGTFTIPVNNTKYLVYKSPVKLGVSWGDLKKWWSKEDAIGTEKSLVDRLRLNFDPRYELPFFNFYVNIIIPILGDKTPALFPQVWLYYNTYTKGAEPQRADFVMFLPNTLVIIELDGIQHYADDNGYFWEAAPKKYSKMVSEDRGFKLKGYDVYRFSNYEIKNNPQCIKGFFEAFYAKHGLI